MNKFLLNEKFRNNLFQILAFVLIFLIGLYFYSNTTANLERQNIQTGFSFFKLEAGFEISEAMIEYWSDDTYLKALGVGLLNTFKVAVIGNFFALILGVLLGVSSYSDNFFIKKFSKLYVEVIRNIPLLLQLFFWYAILTEYLPPVNEAIEFLPSAFITNRGIFIPFFTDYTKFAIIFLIFIIASFIYFLLEKKRDHLQIESGKTFKTFEKLNYLVFLFPVFTWIILGAPKEVTKPVLNGFNFSGGHTLSPEFFALVFGLVIYTAAFICEITRAGINSVDKGQWEACSSLGLSKVDTFKIVILPQALRVMIPPLTSQILNLTKNSSLAVAIGYPDFVSVTNTTMNQTGQAIECVLLIMLCYLLFSLITSLIMNLINSKFKVAQR